MGTRIERWDETRCAGVAICRLHRHGFMTTRTDEFLWEVGKWLRSSAEIGRVEGRRMSRHDGTGLLCSGALAYYGEIARYTV
jgi:hypothetical protein